MPYYNGISTLEAIIYYEKLNRSELIAFLDRFKDLLMVSNYEDPNPLVRINVKQAPTTFLPNFIYVMKFCLFFFQLIFNYII